MLSTLKLSFTLNMRLVSLSRGLLILQVSLNHLTGIRVVYCIFRSKFELNFEET